MSKAALNYFQTKLCLQSQPNLWEGISNVAQPGNKNCEDQISNKETQKSWRDKVVKPHNDFKISGERLTDQEDLGSANLNQKLVQQDENILHKLTTQSDQFDIKKYASDQIQVRVH
ncbi:hypothetical protein Adt_10026 [Abeliophyllum distichum]|uniref:Uncharacterized protein n=1 Tax=Abeliophyllum distichum TaxID=126358 RepID=A0ABD1UJ04_9LAMI